MPNTIAETLSEHFVALTFDDVPETLIDDVSALTLDYLGVALAGSRTRSGEIASRFALDTGGVAEARLIGGRGDKVPALNAAFANAICSHSVELDDVDILALFHFSPPIMSAALAMAERVGASGRDYLTAAAAGCDMMARLSDATNPSLRDRGYHTTPTCGSFGATVAAGKLLGLNQAEMISALGLAGAQAAGLMEMYGPSMQKRFNPGPTARSGITAAIMAKYGFTGADTIFEGERGFCRAFSDEFDTDKLTVRLGKDFPVYIEYKPYSCARPIHNGIDCALDIRRQMGGDLGRVAAIRSIELRRHPSWAHYHLNAGPKTYHEAQVSILYSVGVALVEGAALLPQYKDDKLQDPDIIRLAQMIDVTPDDTLPRGVSCHMTVTTENGDTLTSQVDYPRGSIENPMTAEEMAAKLHLLADDVIGADSANALADAVRGLTGDVAIDQLMERTQATGS